MFEDVAKRVFTPRTMVRIPGLRQILELVCNYIYMTNKAEEALKTAFTEDHQLFGDCFGLPAGCKVAVTTVSVDNGVRRGYLIGNYSRPFSNESEGKSS